jgi:hypothetical protein
MTGPRSAPQQHSGATAVSGKTHLATRALRAVRAVGVFAGTAVSVVVLGDYADDWRKERDAWADGRTGYTGSGTGPGAGSLPGQGSSRS